jgi:ferredoxin
MCEAGFLKPVARITIINRTFLPQSAGNQIPHCPKWLHRIPSTSGCGKASVLAAEVSVSTTLYYFSGTGNSLKIAKDISKGISDCRLRHIAAAMACGDARPVDTEKVGIVFPVYADGLPLIVEKFLRGLKTHPDTYVFAVANYGAAAGGSLLQADTILREKGCGLSGAFGLKMPDNTQILFPPSSEEEQKEDFDNEIIEAANIAGKIDNGIIAGLELFQNAQQLPGASWQRPPFDPRKMAENFATNDTCDGCALCEQVCPVYNIAIDGATPRWLDHCEQCLACMQWCPQKAIQFSEQTSTWGRYHHPEIRVAELLRLNATHCSLQPGG